MINAIFISPVSRTVTELSIQYKECDRQIKGILNGPYESVERVSEWGALSFYFLKNPPKDFGFTFNSNVDRTVSVKGSAVVIYGEEGECPLDGMNQAQVDSVIKSIVWSL